MLYTRKGDKGTSGLFDTKERFPKDSPIYDALGTLDELNALLGMCHAAARQGGEMDNGVASTLQTVQQHLFIVQAEFAGAEKKIMQTHIDWMEAEIAKVEDEIQNPHAFIVPGANTLSALFDFARTVARRNERMCIRAKEIRNVSPETYAYINRLSSLLYALARFAALQVKEKELTPTYL
jgi:cob(I)alamin adenosyltransferase